MMRKLILFLIFCFFTSAFNLSGFQFESVRYEQDIRYLQNQPVEFLGEARIFFSSTAGQYLTLNGTLGTLYKKYNEDYQVNILMWAMEVKYSLFLGLEVTLGNKLVNYSPYLFHSDPWQDNFLQGIFFHIEEIDDIKVDAFIALHAENDNNFLFDPLLEDHIALVSAPNNNQLNIGTIYEQNFNNVWQEHPAVWGGGQFNYQPADELLLKEMYLHENYETDKWGEGYRIFQNNIFLSDFTVQPVFWFHVNLIYSIMNKNYQVYKGAWNYYGKGQNAMYYDYSRSLNPLARVITFKIDTPVRDPKPGAQISFSITSRDIDQEYSPLHMDNGLFDEHRGENELDDIFSGEKGLIFSLQKPLLKSLGIFIERMQLEEHLVYQNRINDTRKEWRYGVFGLKFLRYLEYKIGYRQIKFDDTVFKNNKNELSGYYCSFNGDITEYFTFQLSFIEHRYWVTHNNEFVSKFIFKF